MKKQGKIRKIMAVAMTLLMVTGILPLDFAQTRVKAASQTQVYDSTLKSYQIEENVNLGKVLLPKADGQYPVIIFMHGSGGPSGVASSIYKKMEKWVSAGYADPAVVVLPEIKYLDSRDTTYGVFDFEKFVSLGRCKALVEYLKAPAKTAEEAWKNKIDVSNIDTIVGASMGASAALYAGITHPAIFKNVGAFSPSQLFYMPPSLGGDPNYHWTTDSAKLVFTDAEDAHLMIGYGKGEADQFSNVAPYGAANRYYSTINSNESNKNKFLMYKAPAKAADGTDLPHSYNVFYREFFCYLYYLKFGRVLDGNNAEDAALIEAAVGLGELPALNVLTGTVTLTGNPIYSWAMSAVASDCNCSKSNLAYQWQRDGVDISGETYENHVVGAADVGHRLRCVVTDKTGTYTGSIVSAETDVVVKADGPAPPSGLTATPCTTGLKNGTIKNVTAKMEYSTNDQFSPATACTGTEITNLAPGTYFIRVAGTQTVKPGGYCYVTVPELDPNLQITKKALQLQDTIAINFKVAKSAISGKYHDPYVKVTQNGVTDAITDYKEEGDYLVFTYRVAPHQMGDMVTAVPYALNANGKKLMGETFAYSVAEYCYNMLAKEDYAGAQYATFRRLLVDILRYGDAAQQYAGYKTTELVSRNLTNAQNAMGTNVSVSMAYNSVKEPNYVEADPANTWAVIERAALYLEAAVNVQFKFSANAPTDLRVVITDNAACTNVIGEYPASAQQMDGGLYYVNVDALNAAQMRKTIYATVMKGDKKVSNTYRYSIESYAAAKKDGGDGKLEELIDAMMRYGDSANEFSKKK